LALELDPDRHAVCPQKQVQFQKVNEAYQFLLTDVQTRQRRGGSGDAGTPNFQQNAAISQSLRSTTATGMEIYVESRRTSGNALRSWTGTRSIDKSPLGRGFAFSTMEEKNSKTGGTENNENNNNEDP